MANMDGTGPQGQGMGQGRGMGGKGRGLGVMASESKFNTQCPQDATPRQKAMCEMMKGGKKKAKVQVQKQTPRGQVEIERNIQPGRAKNLMQSARGWNR